MVILEGTDEATGTTPLAIRSVHVPQQRVTPE
jgi:hypothetical protein